MNRRLALATVLVAALAVSAGCTGIFGGGSIPDEELNKNVAYPWDTDTKTTLVVKGDYFKGVYRVQGKSKLSLYREGLSSNNPLDVWGVKFRYPNGTFANGTDLDVDRKGSKTVVHLPQENGTVAFSAHAQPKEFRLPAYVDGPYEVVLPPDRRVGNFLFGHVSPNGHDVSVEDDRVHVTWSDVDNNLLVRYYLQRDLWLFGGLVALLGAVIAGGLAYYVRQIRELERQRQEMGLDVEVETEDEGDDPPGLL